MKVLPANLAKGQKHGFPRDWDGTGVCPDVVVGIHIGADYRH
ncbi:MAG: hypothetical protein N2B03_05785 [Boseongicola sp.]